jgi:hypothetical protein
MPKIEFDGLPVIEVPDSEEITVAVKPEDLQDGDEAGPEQHPIAIGRGGRAASTMRVSPKEKCSSGAAISGLWRAKARVLRLEARSRIAVGCLRGVRHLLGALTHACCQRFSDACNNVADRGRARPKCCAQGMAGNATIRRHVGGRLGRLPFCGGLMKTNLSARMVNANVACAFPHIVEIALDPTNIRTQTSLVTRFHRQRGIRTKRIGRTTTHERIYQRYCFARRAIAEQFAAEFSGKVIVRGTRQPLAPLNLEHSVEANAQRNGNGREISPAGRSCR